MNLPSPKKLIPLLAVLLIALVLIFLPRMDSDFFASIRYERCTGLAAADPAKALALAKTWRAARPLSPLAHHCEAIAFYAAKDYPHAAEDFMSLARESLAKKPSLSAQLALQAARAYALAGQYDMAYATAASVLAYQPANQEAKDLTIEIAKEKQSSLATPPAVPATK